MSANALLIDNIGCRAHCAASGWNCRSPFAATARGPNSGIAAMGADSVTLGGADVCRPSAERAPRLPLFDTTNLPACAVVDLADVAWRQVALAA